MKEFWVLWDHLIAHTERFSCRKFYLTNKEAVYYTVIKHNGHLGKREKCRKHECSITVKYTA